MPSPIAACVYRAGAAGVKQKIATRERGHRVWVHECEAAGRLAASHIVKKGGGVRGPSASSGRAGVGEGFGILPDLNVPRGTLRLWWCGGSGEGRVVARAAGRWWWGWVQV